MREREQQRPRGDPTIAPIHRFFQLAQAFRLPSVILAQTVVTRARTFALTRPDTVPLTDLH